MRRAGRGLALALALASFVALAQDTAVPEPEFVLVRAADLRVLVGEYQRLPRQKIIP